MFKFRIVTYFIQPTQNNLYREAFIWCVPPKKHALHPALGFHGPTGTSPWPICWTAAVNSHPRKCYPTTGPHKNIPHLQWESYCPTNLSSPLHKRSKPLYRLPRGLRQWCHPQNSVKQSRYTRVGVFFSLFQFRGFCPYPQINSTTICQRGLCTKTSNGWIHENNLSTRPSYEKTLPFYGWNLYLFYI